MTKAMFDAICARDEAGSGEHPGDPPIVIICVSQPADGGPAEIINPDELSPDVAARFKSRCQSIHYAARDRRALLAWIITTLRSIGLERAVQHDH